MASPAIEPATPSQAPSTAPTAVPSELPTAPEKLRAKIPPSVAAIVLRLLAKDPAERFQTPQELADALTQDPVHHDGIRLFAEALHDRADERPQRAVVPRPVRRDRLRVLLQHEIDDGLERYVVGVGAVPTAPVDVVADAVLVNLAAWE